MRACVCAAGWSCALVEFVEVIPDNTIKQALLLHYADGVTWQGIALGFGSGTEATWRIRCKRYLSKYIYLHEA